jgi:hypothetical protein
MVAAFAEFEKPLITTRLSSGCKIKGNTRHSLALAELDIRIALNTAA